MKTLDHVTVKEGKTVTIPCLYDSQYKLNPKYWCRGPYWLSCQITARANDIGKWTITDYPAQNIFIVKLNNPTSSDSGNYWCAVEIGTYTNPDDKKHLYLTVKQGTFLLFLCVICGFTCLDLTKYFIQIFAICFQLLMCL